MTEAEWLACTDPGSIVEWLRASGRSSDRKLRLFATACCRRLLPLVREGRAQEWVEVIEEYADGRASKAALRRVRRGVRAARHALRAGGELQWQEWAANWLVEVSATGNAFGGVVDRLHHPSFLGLFDSEVDERASQCALLRDIFHPSRSGDLGSAWLTPDVLGLARTTYEEYGFDRLPILGDALEDAGCTDAEILGHCRGPQGHVRGCWAVDAVLGRA